jgi:lysophospholipase L1-like esterase
MRRGLLLLACAAGAAPEPAAPFTVVALGDSTTAPRAGLKKPYAQLLQEELPGRGIEARVVNAGVGGNTTADALARLEKDVLARKPDLVVVEFGINDSAVAVFATPPAREPPIALDRYRANLREVVRAVRKGGGAVILMTPNSMRWTPALKALYGKPPYKPDDPDGFNVILKDYAAAVRTLADEEKVPLADVYAAFEAHGKKEGQSVDELLLDGMHPNDRGHRIVADLLLAVIGREKKAASDRHR